MSLRPCIGWDKHRCQGSTYHHYRLRKSGMGRSPRSSFKVIQVKAELR